MAENKDYYIEYLQQCYNDRACASDGNRLDLIECDKCHYLMDYEDIVKCKVCQKVHCSIFCECLVITLM